VDQTAAKHGAIDPLLPAAATDAKGVAATESNALPV
jgi:hypothetical protein